jgi:hypothetical protein
MFAEIVNDITLTVQRNFAPWKRARDTALARARMNRVRMKSSLQHN